MTFSGQTKRYMKRWVAALTIAGVVLLQPAAALAQDASGNSTGAGETGAPANTGAQEPTGATGCTGAGCGQGAHQGSNQGAGNGGPTFEDLGGTQDEEGNWSLPEGVADTRQGAGQGGAQGSGNGISVENSNTGADSDNSNDVNAHSNAENSVTNDATDVTNGTAAGNTGGNAANGNTGVGGVSTGNANIGVTQLKNDNTATINGSAGLQVDGHEGDWNGDYAVSFGSATGDLGNGQSIRAINDTTGSDSNNKNNVHTHTEELNEVQNDGLIENILDLEAITGQNEASKNTGDGTITTGDANVAATLVNLLNTTVVNGDLWVTVADIFGDLNGNITLPDFGTLASAATGPGDVVVDASNSSTGSDSNNDIDIDVHDRELTDIDNVAEVTTTVNADAITGQNNADMNTGGSDISTGDASVSAGNVTLANTTIEGGNWGLVVVSALNKWLGFMVGDNGEVRALSQDETIREIEAHNTQTGSDSNNEIDIDLETERETRIANDAVINNEINAKAITGQNEAQANTGGGVIDTGDANIEATAVNLANTTVKDGSLFVAVVNVMGDWFGDLLYDGSSLLAAAGSGGGAGTVEVAAENGETGSDSENTIDVDVSSEQETMIDNVADVKTVLNANVDTGNNVANKNTQGAVIETGVGALALHARTAANLVGLGGSGEGRSLVVDGINHTTGAHSENEINAQVNDTRVVTVNNDANVSTLLPALINTGGNEANYNTLGVEIITGDADADVAINNLLNQVLWALDGGGGALAAGETTEVLADLVNQLTGAHSDNTNGVKVLNDLLADVTNKGVVDNLIDLIITTGRNTMRGNTGGGVLSSGAGCVDGGVSNEVNALRGVPSGGSIVLDQDADVATQAGIDVTTGENVVAENTGALAEAAEQKGCHRVAAAPIGGGVVAPVPAQESSGDDGGDGDDDGEAVSGAVEGAIDRPAVVTPRRGRVHPVLTRFPVAGALGSAQWLEGEESGVSVAWWWLLASGVLLGVAWQADRGRRLVRGDLS